MSQSRLPLLLGAAAAFSSLCATVSAQSLQEPGSGQLFTSFSGQGSIPFRYTPTNSSITSVNVAISIEDPNTGNQTYPIANGLRGTGGNEIEAVFAPIGGWCGAVTLQVYENPGNSTRPTVSRDITVNCGPIQLALPSLEKRQSGGPSGTLTSPSGGASFTSPDGSIDISYTPVTGTFGIDAALVGDANYTLVNGLWKANTSQDITGSFALPSGACGPFELVITEHQIYQNGAIAFRAAAPAINITCSSLTNSTGGPTNVTAPANATSTLPAGATLAPNVTSTSLFPNATSTGNLTVPISNITTTLAPTTNVSSSTAVPVTLVPTANITLPISTETITRPTTIVSTVTTTLVSGTVSVPFTTTVSTIVSPSSTSTSGSSSTGSTGAGGVVGGGSSSSDSSSSSSSSSSDSAAGIRTVTITASGSSSSPQGIVTTTVTPTSTPQGSPTTTRPVTSTVTRTNVIIVEQPNQSRSTSTQRQTVILVSQSIAAVVLASPSTTAAPSSGSTGAASAYVGSSGAAVAVAAIVGLSSLLAVYVM